MPKRGMESVNTAVGRVWVLYSFVRPFTWQDNERPTFGNGYEQD